MNTRRMPVVATAAHPARQADPLIRLQVEQSAVAKTVQYYSELGYNVSSVEKDNKGWDLEATHPVLTQSLKLEVKGLSGTEICVEVTPNEYARMLEHREVYRLCIVTNALATPQLAVFSYSTDSSQWQDAHGRVLQIREIVAAQCRADSEVVELSP